MIYAYFIESSILYPVIPGEVQQYLYIFLACITNC